MYTAKIENSSGEILTLSGYEPEYQIISITGLNPPPAQVNMTDIAGMDGAKFNSSKLNTRNIVITLKLNGDVEANRQNLYRMFRTKESCTFYYSNNNRDVYINGYVETVECDYFSNAETMQISIICPYPYFVSMAEIISDISNELAAFSFPFAIDIGSPIPFSIYESNRTTDVFNDSESETGVIIEVDVLAAISEVEIRNTVTGENLILDYSFQENDRIIINTNKGQKSVKLIRNGITTNIFSAVKKGSTFFQLKVGDNMFGYIVDSGAGDSFVFIVFRFANLYRGV